MDLSVSKLSCYSVPTSTIYNMSSPSSTASSGSTVVLSHDMLMQFESMRNEMKELRAELAATKAELAATKAELAATKAELAATKKELAATKKELAATKKELAATKAELALTKTKLEESVGGRLVRRKKITMMEDECHELCEICLESKCVVQLPCSHKFCHCAIKWFATQYPSAATCPKCRRRC
jgi:adenylosuccinate synthase